MEKETEIEIVEIVDATRTSPMCRSLVRVAERLALCWGTTDVSCNTCSSALRG